MLLLFALSASGQTMNGPYYAGTPAPVYFAQQPASLVPPPAYGPPAVTPPPTASGPSLFDLSQANQQVIADEHTAQGNNLFYNTPWSTLFPQAPSAIQTGANGLMTFAATAKAAGDQISENEIQNEIDYFRQTHPQMTQADRDHLHDLVLERESARNQKLRRVVASIPGTTTSLGSPMSAFFARRGNQDDVTLAQNGLQDARSTYQQDPDQANYVGVRDAQDNVQQFQDRRDADTYDLLGNSLGGAGRLGAIFRKKASATKLQTGYRDRTAAEAAYRADPSEDNRLNLRLANLFIRATQKEDEANNDDIVVSTLVPGGAAIPTSTAMEGLIAENQKFQDCADLWLEYDRVKRQIVVLQRQEAQAKATTAAAASSNTVAQRMLALTTYGGPQSTPSAPAPGQ